MPNLLILVKDCNPETAPGTGTLVEFCATGSDGNKLNGTVLMNFAASSGQMNAAIVDSAKAQYAAAFGVTFQPQDTIKQAGAVS